MMTAPQYTSSAHSTRPSSRKLPLRAFSSSTTSALEEAGQETAACAGLPGGGMA